MISGERKKFGLRPARRALLVDGLSNTVVVYTEGGAQFGYIGFAPSFPAELGKLLPRGLQEDDPVFLHVTHDAGRSTWIVSACTVRSWEQHPLWESATRPTWVKELKHIRHNNDNTETHRPPRAQRERRTSITA